MTLAMWNMAQKWKPRLQSRRFTIVKSSVLHEYRPRYRSIHQPTIGWPIYNRHLTAAGCSLSAHSRSIVFGYTPDISAMEHRHTTDVSMTLVLHVVHTSVNCWQFWMFRGFSLSKCLLSVKSQSDAKISWKLFASFSRLFPVSTLTRARFSFFYKVCCYSADKL